MNSLKHKFFPVNIVKVKRMHYFHMIISNIAKNCSDGEIHVDLKKSWNSNFKKHRKWQRLK